MPVLVQLSFFDGRGVVRSTVVRSKLVDAAHFHGLRDGTSVTRFLDIYGDTSLNKWQIQVFIEEWEGIRRIAQELGLEDQFDEVLSMARQGASTVQHHLRFIGD